MDKEEALDIISEHLSDTVSQVLSDGLPDGADSDLDFDTQLVKDIALAVKRWTVRKGKL